MEDKDIKMLKELIHTYCECEEIGRKSVYLEVTIEQEKALENLLQAYKQDFDDGILNELERLKKENEKLISDNLEYQRTQDIFDKRTYRKKYLEERRKEEPSLLYPDADEIYQRYYKLKKENEELKENYKVLENAYMIDSIPKSVIQDKIEKFRCKLTWGYNDWKYDEKIYQAEYKIIYDIEKELLNKGE